MAIHKFEIDCKCSKKINELKAEISERVSIGNNYFKRIEELEEKLHNYDAMIVKVINLENAFYTLKSEMEKERPIFSGFYDWLVTKGYIKKSIDN